MAFFVRIFFSLLKTAENISIILMFYYENISRKHRESISKIFLNYVIGIIQVRIDITIVSYVLKVEFKENYVFL